MSVLKSKTLLLGINTTSTDCIIWPHARGKNGYGYVQYKGKVRSVHRAVCEEVNGPPPTNKHEAAHSCGRGVDGCFNGNHLYWATPKQNGEDRVKHGVAGIGIPKPSSRGTNNIKAKLTEEEVIAIRQLASTETFSGIANKYGLHHSAVSRIVHRKTWSWL